MTWEHFCHLHGPGNQGAGCLMERDLGHLESVVFSCPFLLFFSPLHTPACICMCTCTLSSCILQLLGKHAN